MAAPGLTAGRGLKLQGQSVCRHRMAGSARPHGWARIETRRRSSLRSEGCGSARPHGWARIETPSVSRIPPSPSPGSARPHGWARIETSSIKGLSLR